jgi:hypothetical protein
MGVTIPPESKRPPAVARTNDPHESVTIAPPAPSVEDFLDPTTPVGSFSNRSDQHFRAAADAGERAGLSLAALAKIAAELRNGVVGARQANEQLLQELSTLRAMLGSANEQQLALKHRLALAEQELGQARADDAHQRQFLIDQQDDFLAALIEEHEQALLAVQSADPTARLSASAEDLAQKTAQSAAARQQLESERERGRAALASAHAQRDEAQLRAEKRERERDELRAEASLLRARLGTHRTASTTPPPPVASTRPPSYRPPQALKLDAGELDATLHGRAPSSRLPSVMPRMTPPPAELQRAVYTPGSAGTARAANASAFPRVSTKPGVGGPGPSERPPAAPLSFGPPPSGQTPAMPSVAPRPGVVSAASLPAFPSQRPVLKQKPDPTTRPLIDYSLGKEGVQSETLEGARLSSKPPHNR